MNTFFFHCWFAEIGPCTFFVEIFGAFKAPCRFSLVVTNGSSMSSLNFALSIKLDIDLSPVLLYSPYESSGGIKKCLFFIPFHDFILSSLKYFHLGTPLLEFPLIWNALTTGFPFFVSPTANGCMTLLPFGSPTPLLSPPSSYLILT